MFRFCTFVRNIVEDAIMNAIKVEQNCAYTKIPNAGIEVGGIVFLDLHEATIHGH